MSLATADVVREIDGVDVVVPDVTMLMDDQTSGDEHGHPADDRRRRRPAPTRVARRSSSRYAQGRALTAEDEGRT